MPEDCALWTILGPIQKPYYSKISAVWGRVAWGLKVYLLCVNSIDAWFHTSSDLNFDDDFVALM